MSKPTAPKTAKRGRPEMSPAQRQDMKTRISEVAKTLFQQEGYAKVSIRRIAKEIGCTPMTLYGYYESKIDILRTLWGDVFRDVFNRLEAINMAADKDTDPQAHLQNLCQAYVDYWITHPEYYRLVFMAEGVTQPDVSLFIDNPDIVTKYGLFLEAIHNLERKAQTADPKTKLDVLISAMHGIVHNKITLSGYEWSPPENQIRYVIKGMLIFTL
ncbi:MAG: TetR/AcrR family transcriptional regulator [Maricaulaceae bacterium]